MKKINIYSVTILLIALVFYGGAGVNFISYCCNLCRHEGIEAVIKDKCCDIHHHHHDDHDEHTSENCCSFERINFDWSAQNFSKQETDFSPVKQDIHSCNLLTLSFVDLIKTGKIHSHIPHGPPKVLPCDYLSILTVLLI